MAGRENLAEIPLGEIAFLSGVPAAAVAAALAGQARLDRLHLEALARAFPDADLKVLRGHNAPEPEASATKRGRVPADHDLVLVLAQDVRAKDLLVYAPRRAPAGTHWLEVSTSVPRGFVHVVTLAGGHEIVTRPDAPYRLARPRS